MNLLKKAFNLTNNHIILLCLLMTFSLTTTVLLSLFKEITSQVIVLYTLMLSAFFAGFFNIIAKIIKKQSTKLSFIEGVGDYFLPMLGIGLISFGLYIVTAVSTMLGVINILDIKNQVNTALNEILPIINTGNLTALNNLSPETIKIYLIIMFSIWTIWGILSFIIIYWVPVLFINNERNIFKSLYYGIKHLFKNFFKTLTAFIAITLVISLTSLLSTITAIYTPILEFIFFTFGYYFAVVFLFTIFLLYTENQKTIEDEK